MVAGPEVTSGSGTTQLVKRLSSKNDPASALLAQAVQATSQEAKARRDKRKAKEKDSPLHQLVELLKGKGGSKKKKKKKDRHRRLLHEEVKADPDPPDGSGSSGSSSSSSPAAGRKRGKSDSDSELSFEPPLRKRAMREPGSVMEMLVKHAQQQMDGQLDRPRGGRPLGGFGHQAGDLFRPADSALPCPRIPAPQRAVCARASDGSPEEWETSGDGGCTRLPVYGRAHGPGRRLLGDSLLPRAVPIGADRLSLNRDHARSPQAQTLGPEEPGLSCHRPMVVRRRARKSFGQSRQGTQRRPKGPRGQRKRKGRNQRAQLGVVERRAEHLEREQGGRQQEVGEAPLEPTENLEMHILQDGLEQSVPLPMHLEKGCFIFRMLAARCQSFAALGRAMAWILFNFPRLESERNVTPTVRYMVMGRFKDREAMHRGTSQRSRPIFPLPLGALTKVQQAAQLSRLEDFCRPHFAGLSAAEIWQALGILGLNGAAGFGRAPCDRKATEVQKRAIDTIGRSTTRALATDLRLDRSPAQAEKELASRFLSYTGEEVPKMQVISFEAALAALPPESHGGSIDALGLVSQGTRWFLEHPDESLLNRPKDGVKLQAKVHVHPCHSMSFFKLLVERRICTWVADQDVLVVNGQQVLNGMFAVGKGSFLDSGEEVQRTIMNLVPSNACFKQLEGATSDLPSICQYLSLVLNGDETLRFFQSDMSSAFYLFRIPPGWSRMLSFNVCFSGESLGLQAGVWYRPGCAVIPMGWHSAVAVMQEVADRLTTIGRLPSSHKVRRSMPLPGWLTQTLDDAKEVDKPWYHVYLDNFCCMSKVRDNGKSAQGEQMHEKLEAAWSSAGVLSSAKKRVAGASEAHELGAQFEGLEGTLGPSPERLLKLIQATLVVIGKHRLRKKWTQVIAGRWVHCMAFRRAAMGWLDSTWAFISGQASGPSVEAKTRGELFGCCVAGLLIHSNLRAQISATTTASDASSTGGAVGSSTCLTQSGKEFAAVDSLNLSGGRLIPVLAISLFNGVGCAFRCYDLCGVTPMVGLSFELNPAANRVTSRRWPHVKILGDVRSITPDMIKEWRYAYPQIEEIHLWGGFPCVDLSSVKAGRLNLDGSESQLFYEIPRILKDIRKTFGYAFKVKFAIENVASMDEAAAAEISRALQVKPLRLDPCDVVPIHRPRFCWLNTDLVAMDGVEVVEKERWFEVRITQAYPELFQWLDPEADWPGFWEGAILPTCMKSIKRARPPPKPAGLHRVDHNGQMRWMADEYRFPPYQYHEKFVIWKGDRWRLINALERELLHGLGYEHTILCWNANDIKRSPQEFEDVRKSLVGDSFSCYSFSFVAAMLCKEWVNIPDYKMLNDRMGMAPGFCCDLSIKIPLQRQLAYGTTSLKPGVVDLHAALLRRANHTGSDVRISSGCLLNPRNYPRQSAASDWWAWNKVFAYRWDKHDHINSLEFRSIIHAVEWRIKHLREVSTRIFHLTDSYICMSIIAKGRTSSRMLKPLLARLSTLLLAFDIYLIVIHVESSDNPTDHDSRS